MWDQSGAPAPPSEQLKAAVAPKLPTASYDESVKQRREARMQLKHPVSKIRIWGWLVQLALLLGAAVCFLQFTSQSAIVSALYGLPSHAQLVAHASHAGNLWFCAWITISALAIALATALLPVSRKSLTPALRGTLRILLALLIVAGGTFGIGEILVRTASHLH